MWFTHEHKLLKNIAFFFFAYFKLLTEIRDIIDKETNMFPQNSLIDNIVIYFWQLYIHINERNWNFIHLASFHFSHTSD